MCNCQLKDQCLMQQKRLTKFVVYQATVATPSIGKHETYIGITENLFKKRFANHKATFNSRSMRTATELSNYIWDLIDRAEKCHTTWRTIKQAPSFNSNYHRCKLCSWKSYCIIFQSEIANLNQRSELIAACRHERKYTLAHCKV